MTIRTVAGIGILTILLTAAAQTAVRPSPNEGVDLENLKMLGMAWTFYANDFDDRLMQSGWQCMDKQTNVPIECSDYYEGGKLIRIGEDLSPESRAAVYWPYLVQPYEKQISYNPSNSMAFWQGGKSHHWFDAPDAKGLNVGIQNSYGYNAVNLSPWVDANGSPTSPILLSAVPRQAQTIAFSDSTFYLVTPDVGNESKVRKQTALVDAWNGNEAGFADLQGQFVSEYWKNLGGSDWTYSYAVRGKGSSKLAPALAIRRIGALNDSGFVFAVATDSHVIQLSPVQVVGDVCHWTTDLDGPHPKCKN